MTDRFDRETDLLPDVYFGEVSGDDEPAEMPEIDDEDEDDDEELDDTPEDVVEILGFDPLDGEGSEEEPFKPKPQTSTSEQRQQIARSAAAARWR